jgi:hypothetical protein
MREIYAKVRERGEIKKMKEKKSKRDKERI